MRLTAEFGRRLLCLGLLAASIGINTAEASGSMRCNSRIVNEGDLAAVLIAACGEPSYRDQWLYQSPELGHYIAETEVWTYDFGSSQLLRLVKLNNGRIVDIDTDGYGFSKAAPRHCEARTISEGLSKYRMLRACGEPLTRRAENVLRSLSSRPEIYRYGHDRDPHRNQYVTPAYREEWVYNFGSRAAMRRVVLEDGWVTYVEQIDRGFDP